MDQLGYDDHNMANALEDYTDLRPADNQTDGRLVAQMFAIIERMSKKKVSHMHDSKDGNKFTYAANAFDTLEINNVQRKRGSP